MSKTSYDKLHRSWNDVKDALNTAGLQGEVAKLTVACRYLKGHSCSSNLSISTQREYPLCFLQVFALPMP